jgi:hypothetical protein
MRMTELPPGSSKSADRKVVKVRLLSPAGIVGFASSALVKIPLRFAVVFWSV